MAGKVFVVGTFNNWEKTAHRMERNSDGWWSTDVPEAKHGDEYLRIDPYSRRVTSSVGNSIITKPFDTIDGDGFNAPDLNAMVIYELHIGTFGKQGNEPGPGDLEGAIDRLSYLKDLGINAVEVMPLAEFAGGYSWGYNPSHIFAVESDYGSPRNFKDFVKKKSSLGAVLVFTAPGIPMIFQGQEFLEDDWFHDQDPVDWTKKDRFAGILQLYKDLISLRLNRGGHTKGLTGQDVNVYHINDDDKILAWHRLDSEAPHDGVVVVANFSSHACQDYLIPFPAAGDWVVRFNSDSRYYDSDFGDFGNAIIHAEPSTNDDSTAQANVSIAPYSALILSQDKQ